jgi:hypothetical protein
VVQEPSCVVWGCEAYVKYFFEGKVFIARNGVFLEKEFLSKEVSGSNVQLEKIQE